MTLLRSLIALTCLVSVTGLAIGSDVVLYEYWPGGYWHGCYYPPGYYVVRQPIIYRTYAVSYDTTTGALIEALDRLTRAIEGRRSDEPITDGVGVVRQRCASCHSAPSPKAGFVLLTEGGLARLTVEDRAKVVARIHSPDPRLRMPPPSAKPLTDSERRLVEQLLFSKGE